MSPLDMRYPMGFPNFRNKQKRFQKSYSRSLCGLASSQYESLHFARKPMHTEKREKERGSLFCYYWCSSLLHKFPLFPIFPYLPSRCLASVNAVRISSSPGALNSRDRMVLKLLLWAWVIQGLSLLLKKVLVLPSASFSFLTAELRGKEAESQPSLWKKIQLISYQHTCVGFRPCY